MKCIKNGEIVKRVRNESAVVLVKQGWVYAPKSEWKSSKQGKPVTTHDEVVVEDIKKIKKNKGAKVKKNKAEVVEPIAEPVPVQEVPKVVKKAKKKVSIEV